MPAPAPAGQLEQVLSALQSVGGQDARIADLMRSGAAQPEALPMLPSSVVGGDVAPEVAEQLSGFSRQLGPTPAKATEPSVTEGGLPREGIRRDKGLRQIREVINLVKTKEGRKNASRIVAEFAPVTEEQAQAISAATGEKIDAGFTHTIDGGYVFHVLRGHGEGREKIQHQLPIVEEDFERIPDVVAHPDKIGSGNKTRQGLNTVAYSKRINGHILVVEAVRNGAKKLSVTTLRKLKPGYEADFSTPDLLGTKETAKPLELTSNNDSQLETERSNAFGLKADEAVSPTSETSPTPSGPVSATSPSSVTLSPSGESVKAETPATQSEAEMRGPKGKEAEPFHANISIPARSKTHHFVAEQSRDSYSHEINILRRDDYTDSKGRSRVKFVNVGSYSPLTGEFSGNVAKGSDKTVLGKLRAQVLEQLRGAQPAEAETQEPPAAVPEASPTPPEPETPALDMAATPVPDVVEPSRAEQILQSLEQLSGEEQGEPPAATQEVSRGIPADAKLRRGEMTVAYKGKDYEVTVSPWEKYGKRRLYLKEKATGKTIGHYDVARGEFGNDFKDSLWSDAVKERFLRQAGDWYEGGQKSAERQAQEDAAAVRRREASVLFPASAALKKGNITVEFRKGSPETLEVSPWEKNGRRLYINEPWFHGRRGATIMYYDVDAGAFAGEDTDYSVPYREAVKAAFLKDIKNFRQGTEDAPYAGKLRKEADARLASVAEIALDLDEGEGAGVVARIPEATRDMLYREILKSQGESDFEKSKKIAGRVMARIRELTGEKTPDLAMMRDPRSVRQSEEYDPGDPKTWPEGPARGEALALEAWRHLEDDDEVETWPESPEKTEALALEKEYDKIAAWIENLSSEEFTRRLQNDDPEFTQKNERGVEIEERFHALRRSLSKKKPKNIEKRLSQLIEAEIDAAQEEALAAQEAEDARIDAELEAEEYYHERPAMNENIRRGRAAMEKVIAEHTDVMDAMYRDELGSIAFLWGNKGAGIAHILKYHIPDGTAPQDFMRTLVDIIAEGDVGEEYPIQNGRKRRVNITKGPYTVVLGKEYDGKKVNWVVSGWDEEVPDKRVPSSDAPDKGQDFSGTTLSETTSSVTERERNGGTTLSKPQSGGNRKGEGAEAKKEPVSVMDVTQKVREMFPLRHGLGSVPPGKRRGVLGVFGRKSEVLRTKYRNNLPVIMHELGHALDKELELRARIPEEALTELLRAGAPVSGEDYTPDKIANEGIAEFVREYAMNRKAGRDAFPKFTPIFERALHEKPDVLKNFEEVRKTLEAYYKQDAKARILDKGPNTRRLSPETLKERVAQIGHDLYSTWVDGNHELARVSERVRENLGLDVLPDELNLHATAQTSAGYMAAADKSVAKLLDVVREHRMTPENRADLEAYMKAARALDYRRNGLNPGLGTTEAEERAIVESQTPQTVRDVARQLHDAYEEIVQETLVDTGLMAQKTFDMLKEKWPNYVPFIRTDSELHEDADVRDFLRGHARSLVNVQNPIKKARGVADEQEIMPVKEPLLHMLSNVVRYHHMAAKQGVAEVIREISRREGCGWIAERLKETPTHSDDSTFYVWENGKQVYYATDPAIHKVLKGLNRAPKFQRGLVGRLLSLPSETLKMGATRYNPAFIITNALRDAAQVSVTSQSWAPPLAHTLRGVMMLYSGRPGGKLSTKRRTSRSSTAV